MRHYPEMSEGFWVDKCPREGSSNWRVPPYGYLTGFELVLDTPIPNMDAASYVRFDASLSSNGQLIAIKNVFSHCRSVR